MRVANRGSDGSSKPFQSNSDGSLKTFQTKQPKGILNKWKKIPDMRYAPVEKITVGYDGYLYFEKDSTIRRLKEVEGEVETGISLNGLNMGNVRLLAVFPSGVVYVTNSTDETGEPCIKVHKGSDFESEPVLLHTLQGDATQPLAVNSQFDGIQEILTICQYSQDVFRDNSAYISFDGGVTIKKVKTVEGASSGANRHYHTMHWDFHQGRLWIGEGDNDANRSIWYSDDIGESWERIESTQYQPTLIASFPNRVIFGRDNYVYRPGFWSYSRPKKEDDFKEINQLTDNLSFGDYPRITGITHYPERMGYAQEGLEAYVCFEPQVSDSEKLPTYIYATGDGGESWHCVFVSVTRMRGAFIKDGYLISASMKDGAELMYTPLIEWV